MSTTHYGYADGRTLCGAYRGLGARWHPGVSGEPRVNCPICISRFAVQQDAKRQP